MILKPSQIRQKKEPVKVFRCGREVCDLLTKAGRDEYVRRKRVMWERQGRICLLCNKPLLWGSAVFEHSEGRGMSGGHRDDRIEKDGKPLNSAAHAWCNSKKASIRLDRFLEEIVP